MLFIYLLPAYVQLFTCICYYYVQYMPMLLLCTIHAYVVIMYNTCLCCYYVQYMPMLLLCATVSTFFRRVVIIGPPIDAYN